MTGTSALPGFRYHLSRCLRLDLSEPALSDRQHISASRRPTSTTACAVTICRQIKSRNPVAQPGRPNDICAGSTTMAFRVNAVWAAVHTGLFASLVLSTLLRPTFVLVTLWGLLVFEV